MVPVRAVGLQQLGGFVLPLHAKTSPHGVTLFAVVAGFWTSLEGSCILSMGSWQHVFVMIMGEQSLHHQSAADDL
jgi:hypothetical protein